MSLLGVDFEEVQLFRTDEEKDADADAGDVATTEHFTFDPME
jgi:hypothetical protein